MNCHEAYLWMLEAEEPTAPPPAALTEHLRDCRKCRRRQKRVFRLLTAVRQLPPPPDNPQARVETMAAVRQTPLRPAMRSHTPRSSRRWLWRTILIAAAAVLVFALFGGLFYYLHERPEPRTPLTDIWKDGDLRTRLLQRDLRLAEAKTPLEQLDALTGMAADLQRESVKQAGRVENGDLTHLAVLYERVIRDGVLPRARALPPKERQTRLPALAAELRQTETAAEQAAVQQPVAAEPLRRLAHTAGDASRALEASKFDLPGTKPKALPATGLLVETLVVQGLRLAEETDPLKRADVCIDVADSLMRTIVEASKRGSDQVEMMRLGSYLGAMDHAVADNLERVDVSAADAKRRAELQRVRQRADKTIVELRRNVEEAPSPSRAALEQALEASRSAKLETISLDPDKQQ